MATKRPRRKFMAVAASERQMRSDGLTKKCGFLSEPALLLAERTGLEPATPGVTGRYSNQLNYRSALTC
jgi:hypothetical protein